MKTMRKYLLITLVTGISVLMTACSDGAPAEAEVRTRYTGLFCDGFTKLELKADSTYYSRRTTRGFATGAPVAEHCEGRYSFKKEGGNWIVVFARSTENSNQLVSCSGEQVIWEKDKGYIGTDSVPELKDLIGGLVVRKNECDL
jgi:hypothetical protein